MAITTCTMKINGERCGKPIPKRHQETGPFMCDACRERCLRAAESVPSSRVPMVADVYQEMARSGRTQEEVVGNTPALDYHVGQRVEAIARLEGEPEEGENLDGHIEAITDTNGQTELAVRSDYTGRLWLVTVDASGQCIEANLSR